MTPTVRGRANLRQMSMSDPFARSPLNQTPPLQDYNTVASDNALVTAVAAHAPADRGNTILASLDELGQVAGSGETREHGMLANTHPPVLHTADRFGVRTDDVQFHPSYHWMLSGASVSVSVRPRGPRRIRAPTYAAAPDSSGGRRWSLAMPVR